MSRTPPESQIKSNKVFCWKKIIKSWINFFAAVAKHLTRINSREEGFALACGLRGNSLSQPGRQDCGRGGCSQCVGSQKAESSWEVEPAYTTALAGPQDSLPPVRFYLVKAPHSSYWRCRRAAEMAQQLRKLVVLRLVRCLVPRIYI